MFVESFDPRQIERTKWAISTKVPEYLSAEKPILAIGPESSGSMEYLKDVAVCINSPSQIDTTIPTILYDEKYLGELASKAYEKYMNNNNKTVLQRKFLEELRLL